jgi:hypothetical protein
MISGDRGEVISVSQDEHGNSCRESITGNTLPFVNTLVADDCIHAGIEFAVRFITVAHNVVLIKCCLLLVFESKITKLTNAVIPHQLLYVDLWIDQWFIGSADQRSVDVIILH